MQKIITEKLSKHLEPLAAMIGTTLNEEYIHKIALWLWYSAQVYEMQEVQEVIEDNGEKKEITASKQVEVDNPQSEAEYIAEKYLESIASLSFGAISNYTQLEAQKQLEKDITNL